MKKITIIIILTVGIFQTVKSGPINLYTNTFIYTCQGGQVSAGVLNANSDLSASQKAGLRNELLSGSFAYLGIQVADILDEATYSYNCHAYAWHLTEGNSNKVWINDQNNNLSTYWNNGTGCFLEVATESQAEKIHYYSDDHSAVISASGKYVSKWGDYPLIRHYPTQVPYTNSGNRKYYRKRPTINGDQYICYSANYTIVTNYLQASSWSLSQSGNVFSITSSNATSATVTATPPNNNTVYYATLTAIVNGASITKDIINSALIGSNFVCPTTSYFINSGQPAVWSVTPGFTITPYNNGINASVTASAPNLSGTVIAVVKNGMPPFTMNISSCGYDVYSKSMAVSHYVSAYPNPASTILIVEINEDATTKIRIMQPDAQAIGATPTYDIRLYNMKGELMRSAKTKDSKVNFDVATLPNDFYFLHVYDGIISAPEVHKIVINH